MLHPSAVFVTASTCAPACPEQAAAAAAHAAMAAEHAQQGGYGDQQHVPPVSGAAGDMHNGGERLKGAINATIQLLSHGHLIT